MSKLKHFFILLVAVLSMTGMTPAQTAEVSISLNEQFFDTLLDAIFRDAPPPEISIASTTQAIRKKDSSAFAMKRECRESIRLLRENSGVQTSVRFRGGKIYAPLAFAGSYNPPFIGCVDFSGWAETLIDIEFDQANQRLIARATVVNVALDGAGSVGGAIVAKLIQGAIDRRANPIEVVKLDSLSFDVPIQGGSKLRMKAVRVGTEVGAQSINIRVTYAFLKS